MSGAALLLSVFALVSGLAVVSPAATPSTSAPRAPAGEAPGRAPGGGSSGGPGPTRSPTASGEAADSSARSSPSSEHFAANMREAAAAFAQREDPARLAQAIALSRRAVELDPSSGEALVALARAHAFRARAEPGVALDAWRVAASAAQRAVRVAAPELGKAIDRGDELGRSVASVGRAGAEPLYWLALSMMGMAQARGMAAVLAVQEPALVMMRRAAELDERTDFGGPRRALGAWLATLPSAAGGGATAAKAELERARLLFPRYQLARVWEAQTLAVLLQDRKRFEALLTEVLRSDDVGDPELEPENRLARRLARDLMARADRLF